MNNLAINTLRIICKSKKYVFGETLLLDIKTNKVELVLISEDIGLSSKKKIIDKCTSFNVNYLVCLDKSTLKDIFQKDISSIGIKDKNLAQKFLENMQK